MHSPAKGRIRAIVFDLWNTLVYNEHRPNPIVAIGRAFGLADAPGWTKAIERGMMLRPMAGIEEGEHRRDSGTADEGRMRTKMKPGNTERCNREPGLTPDGWKSWTT